MKAQLVVVYGKPRNTVKSLPTGDCLIGRGDECQVRTNSPLVSRQHCLVHITKESAVLRDLGSTNGTLVNGKRIVKERKLTSGDLVQIGPVVFEFRDACEDEPAAGTAVRIDSAGKDTTTDLPTIDLSEPVPEQHQAFRSDQTHQQPV